MFDVALNVPIGAIFGFAVCRQAVETCEEVALKCAIDVAVGGQFSCNLECSHGPSLKKHIIVGPASRTIAKSTPSSSHRRVGFEWKECIHEYVAVFTYCTTDNKEISPTFLRKALRVAHQGDKHSLFLRHEAVLV